MASVEKEIVEETLWTAARHLTARGFLQSGDALSQRIPEQDAFVLVKIPAEPDASPVFRWTPLPDKPSCLHHRIYASRADVGAIAAGAMPWCRALTRLDIPLPAVFDEQVRHLGVAVERVAMRSTDDAPIDALRTGANAYCLDDVSLCLGMALERLMPNIEILEKCAQSFVLAHSASGQVRRIPWLVRFIANGRLKKDQKDAAIRHLRGERAIMKAGY